MQTTTENDRHLRQANWSYDDAVASLTQEYLTRIRAGDNELLKRACRVLAQIDIRHETEHTRKEAARPNGNGASQGSPVHDHISHARSEPSKPMTRGGRPEYQKDNLLTKVARDPVFRQMYGGKQLGDYTVKELRGLVDYHTERYRGEGKSVIFLNAVLRAVKDQDDNAKIEGLVEPVRLRRWMEQAALKAKRLKVSKI